MSSSRKNPMIYSPIRAKRRQSDAKWRASVATCYDTLKYVVPNMKNMSKRKISKALILQESEKHIKELESVIKYLFDEECPAKGKIALWKEEYQWTKCTLEKLKADFSEQQQKVFHSSAQGRRCYKLLHNIKEEVFSMQADPKELVFIGGNVAISRLTKKKSETEQSPLLWTESLSSLEPNTKKVATENKEAQVVPVHDDCHQDDCLEAPCFTNLIKQNEKRSRTESHGDVSYFTIRHSEVVPSLSVKEASPVCGKLNYHQVPNSNLNWRDLDSCREQPRKIVLKSEEFSNISVGTVSDSLHTPTPRLDKEYGSKCQGKVGNARKRLCFNTPSREPSSAEMWSQAMLSPDHFGRSLSPMMGSCFTPIKLPEQLQLTAHNNISPSSGENPFIALVSPWKTHAPDTRNNNDYLSGSHLEDNLLCLETMDTIDFEDRPVKDITPDEHGKANDAENLYVHHKTLGSFEKSEAKSQPKCRIKLEKLYEEVENMKHEILAEDDDMHVVPQMEADPVRLDNFGMFTEQLSVNNDSDSDHLDNKDFGAVASERKDFDGFLYYYRQVGPQLKEHLGSKSLQCPKLAMHVAQLWAQMPEQEKTTLITLAKLDTGHQHSTGRLSQDLQELDVLPVDPHQLIQQPFLPLGK